MSHEYNIWSINKELRILTVVRMETKDDGCPEDLFNITLDNTSFDYAPKSVNLTFVYNCPLESRIKYPLPQNAL